MWAQEITDAVFFLKAQSAGVILYIPDQSEGGPDPKHCLSMFYRNAA